MLLSRLTDEMIKCFHRRCLLNLEVCFLSHSSCSFLFFMHFVKSHSVHSAPNSWPCTKSWVHQLSLPWGGRSALQQGLVFFGQLIKFSVWGGHPPLLMNCLVWKLLRMQVICRTVATETGTEDVAWYTTRTSEQSTVSPIDSLLCPPMNKIIVLKWKGKAMKRILGKKEARLIPSLSCL